MRKEKQKACAEETCSKLPSWRKTVVPKHHLLERVMLGRWAKESSAAEVNY